MLQAAKLCVISGCRDWASFGRSSSGRSLLPRGNQHRLCWSWITLKESRATQCYQCQSCCFLPVSPTCGQRLVASSPAVLPLGEFHITSWRWPQLGSVGFCPLIVWKITHLHDNIHSTLKHKKKPKHYSCGSESLQKVIVDAVRLLQLIAGQRRDWDPSQSSFILRLCAFASWRLHVEWIYSLVRAAHLTSAH